MSLQLAAQHLAAQGRGPDTTLVHMTPGEVKGLQAIAMAHGGSLTVNPKTGLPEAGFLRSILPMVAGIALGPAGFGLTAMQAGLATGALTGLATGSLRKGLMAGLGAYGGAGIGSVVSGAGTQAIEAGAGAAPPPVGNAGTMLAQTPIAPGAGSLTGADFAGQAASLSGDAAQALSPQYVQGMADPFGGYPAASVRAGSLGSGSYDPMGGVLNTGVDRPFQYLGMGTPTAPNVTPMPTPITPQPAPITPQPAPAIDTYRNQMDIMSDLRAPKEAALREAGPMGRFTRGIEEIGKDPSKLFNKGNLKYGAAALAPMMFQEQKPVNAPRDSEQYRYSYDPGREMPPTRMGDVGEYRYFNPSYTRLAADGGMMTEMPVERMSDRNDAQMTMANGGQMYAKGGISHLGDYSDGGRLLRGPGDGVSDSIPASIGNKRPARLADGEFVVPARIVSELGNGSTEAGARKLYAMMDRVQKNRVKTVGKGKVAVNSRSEKLLPA